MCKVEEYELNLHKFDIAFGRDVVFLPTNLLIYWSSRASDD